MSTGEKKKEDRDYKRANEKRGKAKERNEEERK